VVPATPLALKPVPEAVALVIVTLELPVLVKVTFSELLLPSLTLLKFKLPGLALSSCVAVWPVPLKVMESGEFGPSLASVTVPVTLPVAVGANTMLNVLFAPGLMDIGSAGIPVVLKPGPVTFACDTVTVAEPPFVRVMVCELLFPVLTFPKLALEGLAVSWPCTPLPLRAIVAGDPGALLEMEMLPVAFPAVVGENLAEKVTLAPGLIVCAPNPLKLKPVPEAVAAVIFNAPLPEFVRVTF